MTATNHTEHYGLSQYTEDDHPTYTGDYNGDMSKIDAAIYAASQTGGGGMATVEHTADLTGDGSADSPLGVADTIARTEDIPSLDGYATAENVTQAIAAAIADRLTAGDIKPGNGINIETSGNQVTISYVGGGSSGGLTAIAHDATLAGDGTSANPLKQADNDMLSETSRNIPGNNLDLLTNRGVYTFNQTMNGTLPGDSNLHGVIMVFKYYSNLQFMITSYPKVQMYVRVATGSGSWGPWNEYAQKTDIPDVSVLTSRIATLESQVAALTAAAAPSATGLTAEQLDSQYLDGYNIVRVGAPTPQIESEVNPNE